MQGRADVIYGSGVSGHAAHRVIYYDTIRVIAFSRYSNVLTDLNLANMEPCCKVFTKEALAGVNLQEKGFGIIPELTAKMAKKKLPLYEALSLTMSVHLLVLEENRVAGLT